jgi:carbamoyl-phosphate synthase large subunit
VSATPAILLTGVGKRYDIVSSFAALTRTVAVDASPLAPAQYAAHVRAEAPPFDSAGYVPALERLCAEHSVGAVLPLTDLDIETLARATAEGRLPGLVPSPEIARATYDKYEAHQLLERLGLPSPPTLLPDATDEELAALRYPLVVKPRRGSGARSIHLARTPEEARFFISYVEGATPGRPGAGGSHGGGWNADVRGPAGEPVMVQEAMHGEELSIDCLGDRDGRCLNAIPRTMIESRGGESVKGTVVRDPELVELGRHAMEALAIRGPATIQVFRDPQVGLAITDLNTRFGGAFPGPAYAAHPGRSYPELIVRLAAEESVEPHVGEYAAPVTFSRYYWQLELDAAMRPTGRELPRSAHLRADGATDARMSGS